MPLRSFVSANGATLIEAGRATVLTTAPVQWAYAAAAPIVPPLNPRNTVTARMRVRVMQGQLGIGVAPQGNGVSVRSRADVPNVVGSHLIVGRFIAMLG